MDTDLIRPLAFPWRLIAQEIEFAVTTSRAIAQDLANEQVTWPKYVLRFVRCQFRHEVAAKEGQAQVHGDWFAPNLKRVHGEEPMRCGDPDQFLVVGGYPLASQD